MELKQSKDKGEVNKIGGSPPLYLSGVKGGWGIVVVDVQVCENKNKAK